MQKGLNDFLTSEKIAILGNPIPKEGTEIDWNSDQILLNSKLVFPLNLKCLLKIKKQLNLLKLKQMLK